jgi:hypothetical protein
VLCRKLRRRTERFAGTERTVEAILAFAEKTTSEEHSHKIDPDFYSCEFIGFLDSEESRVGCMLHPLYPGNESVDWRGVSFHGTMACQGFFCRSNRELSDAEKRIILNTIQDWYLYGLVISDADYVKTFFSMLQVKLGRAVEPKRFLSSQATAVMHEFFQWKIGWPFKRPETQVRGSIGCHTFLEEQLPVQQESVKEPLSPVELIFRSLHSEFRSHSERNRAGQMVDNLFSRLAKLV